LLKRIKIKWYKIKESTLEKIKIEGPHIKFCEKVNWVAYNKAKINGASAEVGLGIKNISFVNNLIKSKAI
jgi:hypothetical protein